MSPFEEAEEVSEALWSLLDLEPDETFQGMDMEQFAVWLQRKLD